MVADQNPSARAAFEKAGFLPSYVEMVLPLVEVGRGVGGDSEGRRGGTAGKAG